MLKITQKTFNGLVETLNHRMTKIEGDIKWMKWLGYYMATLMTVIVFKSIFIN